MALGAGAGLGLAESTAVGDRPRSRPPLSPQEGWLTNGRQVLHFQPLRYDRWSQSLELTVGELIPGQAPLLKRRKQVGRDAAIRLWVDKRRQGWSICPPQWNPPPPLRPPAPPGARRMGF